MLDVLGTCPSVQPEQLPAAGAWGKAVVARLPADSQVRHGGPASTSQSQNVGFGATDTLHAGPAYWCHCNLLRCNLHLLGGPEEHNTEHERRAQNTRKQGVGVASISLADLTATPTLC